MLKNTKEFITLWVLLILALGFISYMTAPANPIVRPRLERIEPFQNATGITPEGKVESSNTLAPAETGLVNPREPYNLLNGVLPPYSGNPGGVSPSAASCYDADFQKRLERTGNFRQLTNNYKRAVPDSCSAPNHDLVLSFYKVEPLGGA